MQLYSHGAQTECDRAQRHDNLRHDNLHLRAQQAHAYLARIGIAPETHVTARPSLARLAQLQARHMRAVPFENLAVIWEEPMALAPDILFDKIVTRRRGGFCYELNGAFGLLLRALGYRVEFLAAQVYDAQRKQFGPPYDHMTLLVSFDEANLDATYLVDVGFGDACRRPLRLPDGADLTRGDPTPPLDDITGAYRFRPATATEIATVISTETAPKTVTPTGSEHPSLVLESQPTPPASDAPAQATAWEPQFLFDTQPHTWADYAPMFGYHSRDRKSTFTRSIICSIAGPHGRFTLSTDRLIVTRHGRRTVTPIPDRATRDRILAAYFGVKIDKPTA